METENNLRIKVIGIGGGGNNAVTNIIKDKVKNVETFLINTETKILQRAETKNVLQIGKETTNGLGAGANDLVGEKAALESENEIRELLENTDMLFLTAGMGGGTGTGALPVVARIAKEMEILTVAIVTKPFTFEGRGRISRAERGIEKLKDNVNALIVICNDKLDPKATMQESFKVADNVLKQGIQSVIDIITSVGEINLDFADIKTVLDYKGKGYMGIGKGKGENAVIEATKKAIDNPLTEYQIDNAKGIIFNVTGGEKALKLSEVNTAIGLVNNRVNANADVIFGTVVDDNMEDEVVVTVIATGVE